MNEKQIKKHLSKSSVFCLDGVANIGASIVVVAIVSVAIATKVIAKRLSRRLRVTGGRAVLVTVRLGERGLLLRCRRRCRHESREQGGKGERQILSRLPIPDPAGSFPVRLALFDLSVFHCPCSTP